MRALIAFLLIAFAGSAAAQEYPFLKWSTTEGLAQSQVRCIHQDHLGYLWIGTLGGVSRFDGNGFKSFSRRDGLLSNQIFNISEVGDSLLVFASIGGLTLYDGAEFRTLRFEGSYAQAQVNQIVVAQGGERVLIATENGVLSANRSLTKVDSLANFNGVHVKRLFLGMDGGWTIVTRSDLRTCAAIDAPIEVWLPDSAIQAVVLDGCSDGSKGVLMATVGRGVLHFDGRELTGLSVDEGLISENTTGIVKGKAANEFWVRSRDGFSRIVFSNNRKRAEVQSFDQASGLDVTDVRALLVDREANLWLGTYGGGIRKFIGTGVMHFTSEHGLAGDIVMTILDDADGDFWFGTYDNGISRMSNGVLSSYGLEAGLLNTRVWSSVRTRDGRAWFGTSGGLSLWKGDGFTTFTTADGLPHNQVLSLTGDTDGRLWIGTARGLGFLTEGSTAITPIEGTGELRVRAVVPLQNGVWMATSTGVWKLTSTALTGFGEAEGMPDNSVFCLRQSPDGKLWAGTESGIAVIDPVTGSIENLFLEGGFGANNVNFIAFETNGTTWIGTNDGVFTGNYADRSWTHLGRHDGISYTETNQNAVWVSDSLVWFGTGGALTRLDRSLLPAARSIANVSVRIDEVRINLVKPNFARYGESPTGYGDYPAQVTVPYTDNTFSFYFNALSMRDPENLRFQYMLEGIDDDWEAPTEEAFTSYAQLDFGSYTFRVRAIDGSGQVSDVAEFAFEIRPPLWFRWWFVLLEIAAVAGIVWLIWRARRAAFLARVDRERLVSRSRMLALESQSLNSSMNRHFIFNALNAIQYYINRQDRLAANRYLSSFAKLIRKNLDSSQVNFATLNDEVERLSLYLQLERMRFSDRFDYTIDIDPELDEHSVKLPSMLLQPFLENSIWHGILPKEGQGKVSVTIAPYGDNAMAVDIEDDGIGISTSLKSKSADDDHISHGMQITRNRLELLQKMSGKPMQIIGPQDIVDRDGAVLGTRVKLILPLDLSED